MKAANGGPVQVDERLSRQEVEGELESRLSRLEQDEARFS